MSAPTARPTITKPATIIVAVLSLVDFAILGRAWAYSRADFIAVAATIVVTLGVGVEAGVSAGVIMSIVLHLYKSSRPHVAEVGLVPGTQHFRNILRHEVQTDPAIVTLRIDESLYFANARFLEDYVADRVTPDCAVRHVVLMCSAISDIDLSALESLEAIAHRRAFQLQRPVLATAHDIPYPTAFSDDDPRGLGAAPKGRDGPVRVRGAF